MSETPDFTAPAARGQQTDTVIPRFYLKPMKNNFKSNLEGRPIFEDVEMVEIRIPGDRNSLVDTFVKPEHKARWPQFYAAFKAEQEAPAEGTPLAEWPRITRSQAEELAFFHVKTVEQLAGLSDEQLSKCIPMGGHPLREAAQRSISDAAGAAPMEKLAAENAAKDARIAVLESNLADLTARIDEMTAQRNASPAPQT